MTDRLAERGEGSVHGVPGRRRVVGVCLAAVLLAGCVGRPEAPQRLPELVLDIADPMVEARIGETALRLRVDLDRRNTVELNPAAAARLALPFEAGDGALVGRVELSERNALAPVTVGGVTMPLTVSVFDRECCAGTDGAIGPDLLPYDRVRFVRAAGVAGATERRFPLDRSGEAGLTVATPTPQGEVVVGFSLGYPGTLATAAAGAILAQAYGGRLSGARFDVAPAFGVSRPAQRIVLARAVELGGFPVVDLPVRIADYRGSRILPSEPAGAGEIVVRRRGPRGQAARPLVLIGRDRIDRCAEIRFDREPRTITLRCDFAGAPR